MSIYYFLDYLTIEIDTFIRQISFSRTKTSYVIGHFIDFNNALFRVDNSL